MLTHIRNLKDGRRAIYRCECGRRVTVWKNNVSTGHTRSCGCLRRQVNRDRFLKHGHKAGGKRSRTYVIWMNLKARCNNPNSRHFKNYGGRGISYAPTWEKFENFLKDMGECPEPLTIERIDSDGNYSKRNCRWATRTVQARNRRTVILYEWRGQQLSVAELARLSGIKRLTLRHRLRAGWSLEEAMTTPPQ